MDDNNDGWKGWIRSLVNVCIVLGSLFTFYHWLGEDIRSIRSEIRATEESTRAEFQRGIESLRNDIRISDSRINENSEKIARLDERNKIASN